MRPGRFKPSQSADGGARRSCAGMSEGLPRWVHSDLPSSAPPDSMAVAPLRAGPSCGLPGQAPEQRDWVKIQSAKSSKAGQDSTGVDSVITDEAELMTNCQTSNQPKVGPAASQAITNAMARMDAPARPTCRSHQRANEEKCESLLPIYATGSK